MASSGLRVALLPPRCLPPFKPCSQQGSLSRHSGAYTCQAQWHAPATWEAGSRVASSRPAWVSWREPTQGTSKGSVYREHL